MDRAEQALYEELRRRGVGRDVLAAMASVPRELFTPPDAGRRAYVNEPLAIGAGQTISQPYVVARMCELLALTGTERVLDVGTGSGWHAAVLARLASHVWSIERHAQLSRRAGRNLAAAGVENVTLLIGDGTLGHPAAAPYDAINVAAGATGCVPPALEEQLADGGRLVVPVDDRLILARRRGETITRRACEGVRFVPLVAD
ncbi:protein-L-isoaspartate(D-aspartate) O-methyltransferase [Capillimicrobium parvum]|uniref:Protein-L-isoaspartate O-methyltransferase n=1 Tax=Capillimicrobium parvum TaxID=2884022 RepID=A0A9E6XZ15_9ACTN|nr:protein-L-isoaspartate(D-aspartate) O-methyltransferase [Capillimicrobium parvum]UGS36638.1 Protein-L-isoaspartate O-methyltransferase [Capillimicrobium parvum]